MSKNSEAVVRRDLSHAVKIDQSMLRFVLDQGRDCIKILSPEGHVEYVNSEGRCALEITDFSRVCGKLWTKLWPNESQPVIAAALRSAQAGESVEVEASRPDSNGEKRWWHISVSPLKEADGELAGILTISRDVTEHVRLREMERTLALEMRHRLRNAYTIAGAIVMQSARKDAKAMAFAETVCSRLADVALSQTQLLDAGDKSWTIIDLISTLVTAHGEGAAGIRYTGPADAMVDGHEAMLVALVIGELTNNSLKYGALRRNRSVALSWSNQAGHLRLHWREQISKDKGVTQLEPRDEGSGYSMMERMARNQRATLEQGVDAGELHVKLALRHRS
jgi:PAS domain S-box-containing protein